MMSAVSDPASAFVLSSVRHDPGAAGVRAWAAATVRDWERVARLALQHDVPWWVWRALPPDHVPEDVRAMLGDAVRELAMRSLAGTRELLAMTDALERAGVPVLAYKGPALGVDVHGDVASRRFTDLDLLVAEHDLAATRAVLGGLGYGPPTEYSEREATFYGVWEGVAQLANPDASWPVELHWRCQAPRYGAPGDPAALFPTSRRMAIGGASLRVPGVEEQAALLALHGVKHAWGSLLWVVDFAHAVQRDGFDWNRVAAIAAVWGQTRALLEAVLVAHDLLAVPVPESLLLRAREDARAVRLAHAAVDALYGRPTADTVGRESTPRYDLQWLGGVWPRVRYLALAALLPTPQERRFLRLPDALLFLAYPVRLLRLLAHAVGWRR